MSWTRSIVVLMSTSLMLAAAQLTTTGPAGAAETARPGAMVPVRLETAGLADPIGIDDTEPTLSWELKTGREESRQAAYQIRAASTSARLAAGRADLWDSGRVRSSINHGVAYDGRAVDSRDHVFWQVRVWDERGGVSRWSDPASWEVGLVDEADWDADWIGNPVWEEPVAHPMPVDLSTPASGRYLRISVTRLDGATTDPFAENREARLQLGEIEVFDSTDPSANFAAGADVVASESDDTDGEWAPGYLTDGERLSSAAPRGYSSESHPTLDVSSKPITLTVDLGEKRSFNRVRLYPRSDLQDQFARSANYPRNFSVEVSDAPDTGFQTVRSYSNQQPPSAQHTQPMALPIFAKQFDLKRDVRSARLYVTGMGVYSATINGQAVTDAVLEPPNTDVRDQVVASAYDVTGLLRSGQNRFAAELGTGMAQVNRAASNRYQYMNSDYSPPRLLAQLEITTTDGRRHVVATDGSWQTTLGATTTANWYGGEDYDARREQAGWREPGTSLTGWDTAEVTEPPFETTEIVGRTAPPITQVDALRATSVTNPEAGTYIVDFGTNVVGWPELTADGAAGTEVRMYPAEQLDKDGTVLQTQYSGRNRVWQAMTLDGTGPLTWHPRFNYSGFRYLEITGLSAAPALADVRALVLRTDNAAAGTVESSDPLLNSIHGIINRAIQGNMYSVLTDCPHREKFGWTEQLNLVFDSVAKNYDVEAYYRKIVQDMADSQTSFGLVPDITPEYTEFSEWNVGYRDDANWGGSIILAPWLMYRAYGDVETMRTFYPNMQRYLDYLSGRADGHILGQGLGDWIAIDTTTPLELVGTQAYYKLASTLSQVARTIGKKQDAEKYAALAADIADAFNAEFFDAATGDYGPGNQTSNGLALDADLVPADHRDQVLGNLIESIRAADDHLRVGEIGLPAILDVLAEEGRDDVIYDIATQTTYPSYGYLVETGSTALPEAWTGMTKSGSQNHYMLGAIDDWFWSGLGGIEQAPGSVAFRDLVIAPAVVGDLTSHHAGYRTPQGEVVTDWQLDGDRLDLQVTVPANTTATVKVPLDKVGGADAKLSAGGLRPTRVSDEYAVYEVRAGAWRFVASAR
ncbi:alpha-L-rhamnosidase [Nocardioides sp. YR527]|uniref:family 78 glycoside hydrolase catalytic domain n=1 Tax=Nocardioides sp. YR527 TaxID=1881028 RepID=UPI000887FDA8|nr:family 78 glycoside hydrolase catalytic domain [Nocardioides sp. YR527]SDK22236.1 alpha-L-rhamnosidase [Nocardioides sp. YR527]